MSKLKNSISFNWDKDKKRFVDPVPEYIKQIVAEANRRYRISTYRKKHPDNVV